MKTKFKAVVAILGVSTGLTLWTSQAIAGCADIPGGAAPPPAAEPRAPRLEDQPRLMNAAFLRVDAERASDAPAIVGMWKFQFVAQGNPSGPPDGTVIDHGYVTWHSDGTELTNSGGRPPQSGDFCMGVWKQTGGATYKLNHYAAAWEPDGSAYLGPANIRQEVTVNRSGTVYYGSFTIDQYDAAGTSVLAHVAGAVTATRITINGGGL